MTHTTEIVPTWSWLRSTSRALYTLSDELPPLSATFPLEKLQEALKTAFHLANFSLELGEQNVRDSRDFDHGIGEGIKRVTVKAAGVEGVLTWLLPEVLVDVLTGKMLEISQSDAEALPGDFKTGFFHFVVAETLLQLNAVGFQKLTFMRAEEAEEDEAATTQDLFVHVGPLRYLTRLIFSQDFQIALHNKNPPALSPQRLQGLDVRLHVLAGRTSLNLSHLLRAAPGDFLAIDQPFYDPEHESKSCYLTLKEQVLFRAEIQGPHLTIQEIPSHTEVNNSMPQKLSMENDAPLEEHPIEAALTDDDEDSEDIFKDESDIEDDDRDDYELQEGHLAAPSKKEVHAEEEQSQDAPSHEEVESSEEELPKKAVKAPKTRAPITRPDHPIAGGKVTLNDVAVTVNIELAEIDISAQKLLELQPGSVLDLQSDGSTVLLVVNNKIIGKGEVIKIGSTLGVRILELGAE